MRRLVYLTPLALWLAFCGLLPGTGHAQGRGQYLNMLAPPVKPVRLSVSMSSAASELTFELFMPARKPSMRS